MKRTYLMTAAIALVALGMTACGGSKEEATEEAAPVTYALDAATSSLNWTGDYADNSHSHHGKIALKEGSVVYNGDEFTSGNFSVDMASIMDEDLTDAQRDTLNKHLSGPFFFNAAQFPATTVTVKEVHDKDIKAVINVLGKDMETTIPVKITKTADKLTATGKFDIDFTAAGMMGMKPMDPSKPDQYVKPVVHFDLNLVMNAEAAN